MAADGEGRRLRDLDPILTVCAVVLLLASGTVLGVFVNDRYIAGDGSDPAAVGDRISADYVGSYYGFYDEGGAVFDTSMYSVASGDQRKSLEFSLKGESSYRPLSFTLGVSTNYLKDFMNPMIGKRTGESARICIAPADGYGELTDKNLRTVGECSVPLVQNIDVKTVKEYYGIDIKGNMTDVKTPFGWNADLSVSGGAMVTVVHRPAADTEYEMDDKVKAKVTGISGGEVRFRYVFDAVKVTVRDGDPEPTDGSDPTVFKHPDNETYPDPYQRIELVKVLYMDKGSYEHIYLMAADDPDSAEPTFVGKNTDEKTGMYLYFMVKRV